MGRIDQAGDDVADRAETDADALEAIEREERMLDTPSVTSLVEWIVNRNLLHEVAARLSYMSRDQILATLDALKCAGDAGITPEMAQLHMALVNVKGDEERSEARLARRAEKKRLVEKARELLGLAISLDTALETETSRKLFNTALDTLKSLDVAP